MRMTPRERFEAAVKLAEVDRVPAASPVQTGTIPLMNASGAYWPEAHRIAEKMASLALAAHEVGGIESLRVPFCGTVEAEAVGCELGGWEKYRQPKTVTFLLQNNDVIDKLEVPDPQKAGRMPEVIRAIQILSKKFGKTLPLIAAIVSPFEFAVRSRSMGTVIRDLLTKPELIHKVLNFAVKVEVEYAKALIEAGATAISFIDGSSNADILGPQFYEIFSKPYTREVISNLKIPTILHICGNSLSIIEKMADTGATALSIDHTVPIKQAKEIVGRRASIIGNVDPVKTLLLGVPDEVEAEAKDCIGNGTDVLAPGCGFPPMTPLENMNALAGAVREYEHKR